jgi:hypothetical protein
LRPGPLDNVLADRETIARYLSLWREAPAGKCSLAAAHAASASMHRDAV